MTKDIMHIRDSWTMSYI